MLAIPAAKVGSQASEVLGSERLDRVARHHDLQWHRLSLMGSLVPGFISLHAP